MQDMVATMVEDRKIAKQAQNKIDVANKKRILIEAENTKLRAEIDYLQARIKELEHMIRNAEVISENRGTSYVRLGSTVTVEPMDTHEKITFTIVGTVEADPLNGKVSNATPLAEAILEKKVGTVVTVEVDEPYDVKIVEIK